MDQVKEIRFVDSDDRELFRIPDGANIKLRFPPEDYEFGKPDIVTYPCKYLDETHVRVGTVDYSMHQFAVFMEENGSYEPEIQIRDASIASFSEDDRNYFDLNSDEGKTWVAHLSGDFGYKGERFGYDSDTNENQADKDTPELQAEVHSAVYAFRQSLLKNRATMMAYCRAHPNAVLHEGKDFSEYGFKLETEDRRYFVLCHVAKNSEHMRTQDTRFDIYAYNRAAHIFEQKQTDKGVEWHDTIAPDEIIPVSHCNSISNVDFLGKVIVVRADALPPEKRQARSQLFLAMCGQGTSPNPPDFNGTKFWGVDLHTGKEQHIFNRSEILGTLKPEYLPQWAKETLENLDVEVKRIINNARAIAQRQSGHSR